MARKKKEVGKVLSGGPSNQGEQVFIWTNKNELVPFAKMKRYEVKKDSQQLEQENNFGVKQLVSPPFPPTSFISLEENNSVLAACIDQIAKDASGNGYRLVINDDVSEESREVKEEQDRIEGFFQKINSDGETLRKILYKMISDYETVGWFGLEVVRGKNLNEETRVPTISELWHVPAHTLRRHQDKKRVAQQLNGKTVWYKIYGADDINVGTTDGRSLPSTADILDPAVGNEIIFYNRYYRRSSYYGVPRILSAVGSVVGLIGIRDYNISFFENYGVPAAVVTLSGSWAPGSNKKIKDFLDSEIRGSDNQHKTIVLTTPEGCKIDWKPLVTDVKEGSFRLIRKDFTTDILVVYRMPEERIGIRTQGKLGGNVAAEATRVYNSTTVEPLQLDIEELVNQKILKEGLGVKYHKFKLNDLDLRDIDLKVERYEKLFGMGAITPNQIIKKLDLGSPYDEGDKYYVKTGFVEAGEDLEFAKSADVIKELKELRRQIEKGQTI